MTEQEYEPLPLDVPKGWYPMPDGRHRYWDGKKWTEKFTSSPPTPKQTKRRQRNLGWLAWAVGIVLIAALGLAAVRILHLETQQQQLIQQFKQEIDKVRP